MLERATLNLYEELLLGEESRIALCAGSDAAVATDEELSFPFSPKQIKQLSQLGIVLP